MACPVRLVRTHKDGVANGMKPNEHDIRVFHIVGGNLGGGAARGAYRLHRGLLARGCHSRLLIQSGISEDPTVVAAGATRIDRAAIRLKAVADQAPLVLYRNRQGAIFSPGLVGTNPLNFDDCRSADIVHLHWVGHGFLSTSRIPRLGKPVVWTMRDMWPFTGGCHQSGDCDKFRDRCGACPHLRSSLGFDLSRLIQYRKRRHLRDGVHPVAISTWLADVARSSAVLREREITVIHNSVDTEVFHPIAKSQARTVLGLPLGRPIVVYGALHASSDRTKGLYHLIKAIPRLASDPFFLVFGTSSNSDLVAAAGSENVRFLGVLRDDVSLALAYASGDAFIAPYLQDAFGKTIIEAMACGTPAVTYGGTGPRDIVTHKEDGYLAEHGSIEDLAHGIDWVLTQTVRQCTLGSKARRTVESRFTNEVIAAKYIDLYRRILD